MRDGDFDASRLDEKAVTSEIREVNIGFNRMAQQLAKIEQDRAVMLAGISHDLRTPLARLRLETEMSVADADARDHMAADIDQLDAIIDKFLDYARPDHAELKPVLLNDVIEACLYAVAGPRRHAHQPRHAQEPARCWPTRWNWPAWSPTCWRTRAATARRRKPASRWWTSPRKSRNEWVLLKVRDHGMGVAPEALPNLIKPFFRGDAARTAATGAGLGLAIVDKTVQRMGGIFALANTTSGGLAAHIKLQRPSRCRRCRRRARAGTQGEARKRRPETR